MSKNHIAILIATYNGEKYIREQLDSLLNQSYQDWEAYIHDDGSDDHTMDILEEYTLKYPKHFHIIKGDSTGGARNNFLFLIKQVKAELYMCCDQDDVWLPDKVKITLDFMKEKDINNKPCLVYTDLKVVNKDLDVISESMNSYQKLNCENNSINHLLVQNVVTGCTMMFNRQLRDEIIKYQNSKSIIMHDWWASLIAAQMGEIYYLPEQTILYRQHGMNSVGAQETNLRSFLKKVHKNERAKIFNSIKMTQLQSKELVDVFSLSQLSLPYIYSNIGNKNKLKRIWIYHKYKFQKSSFFRTLGLYFFG